MEWNKKSITQENLEIHKYVEINNTVSQWVKESIIDRHFGMNKNENTAHQDKWIYLGQCIKRKIYSCKYPS